MKLSKLLEGLKYSLTAGNTGKELDANAIEISKVVNDNRKISEGDLFICIKGANFDGHSCAFEAAQKNASAIVIEHDVELPENCEMAVIRVEDTRYAMAFISAAYFDHPARKLKTVGITGTKGKTTTTYLIRSMLENAGHKCGLIGTIEVIIGDEHIHAENTTPESFALQEYMAKMVEAGCDCVVMAVSSQVLMLHRSQGSLLISSLTISGQMSTRILKTICTARDSCSNSVRPVSVTEMIFIQRIFLRDIPAKLRHMDLMRVWI